MRAPIGFRIRNQRKLLDISQAQMARNIGISPSYLNLIEASKRDVGGILLQKIAKELNLELDKLTGESEQRIISDIKDIFADPIMRGVELSQEEMREFVTRFPKMASSLVHIYRSFIDANANIEAYANRLKTDPLFSQLLHQVLSQITAIRSSSEILENVADITHLEREKFLKSISRDSNRLGDVAKNLIGHFDQTTKIHRFVTPIRELDDLIIAENNYFALLEDVANSLRLEIEQKGEFNEANLSACLQEKFAVKIENAWLANKNSSESAEQFLFDEKTKTLKFQGSTSLATRQFQLAKLFAKLSSSEQLNALANDDRLTSFEAKNLAFSSFASYIAGAMVLPYRQILDDAKKSQYDIDYLGQKYSASFEQIAHRLVTLRKKGDEGIEFGFLRSDPAGRLTKHFPLAGLLLPNTGHACPLWAIYRAFQSGSHTVRQIVRFADGSRFLFIAKTVSKRLTSFRDQQFSSSVMLACDISYAKQTVYSRGLDLDDENSDVLVGPSCRLCVLNSCAHRQEEALYPTEEI